MKQIICKSLNECQIIDNPIMRNILVPFDDSKHANRVFGYALTLAKTFGASLLIAAITQDDLDRSWVNGVPSREKGMSKYSITNLKEGISKLQHQAKNLDIKFNSTIISSKDVRATLLALIDSQKIDLVIMGTRGRGEMKEMMLGRVSTTIALNSVCPVLLIK
jgi:nucleotide-binding universal stress UspA family protein